MNIKRVSALVFSMIVIMSLTSCKIKKEDTETQTSTTTVVEESVSQTVTQNISDTATTVSEVVTSDTTVYATTTENYVQESTSYQPIETTAVVTRAEVTTTEAYDDPANWSKERIVEEYKKAATKSHSTAKSTTKITLKDISVNNGEYDKAMSFVKPIIAKFIESNSTENTGITGGFENLVSQDVSSAKAYKSGNDTIIEMTLVEQTSGPKEDANSGSVGHAITTVGDINAVVKDLSDMGLSMELSEQDTKIYYTNPGLKVVINDNGEIVSGTWNYTVQICMDNMKAFGQTVEKASITMDNTITV